MESRGADERVLVLAPTGRDGPLAASILAHAGIATHICASASDLLDGLPDGAAAILVAEEALDPLLLPRLVEILTGQPSWSDLPVVLITSSAASARMPLTVLHEVEHLGNVMLLERPVRVMTLLSTVQTALRARRRQYEVRDHLAERTRLDAARERLLAAEQTARAEMEAANRAKDEFLAVLSHELRTPLQAMLGWLRLLRTGRLDPSTTARAFEALERNTGTQAQLIEDLLDVSRIVAGKLRVEVRPTALGAVVEAAVDAVRAAAQDKHITLEVLLQSPRVLVLGDPARLQQVVWNLVSNAVKFTPQGGRVVIEVAVRDGAAVLGVRDTGRGIAADALPHIFQRFRQADSTTTRSAGGLGLGLAIVRHLVELHGGTITAESAGEGHGTTFTVTLPLAPAAVTAGHAPAPNSGEAPAHASSMLAGLVILVVEDDRDTRELLLHALQAHGGHVRTADSVEEALRAIERQRPDVVVSDISMPGQDGYALARRLRLLDGDGRRLPALALTAHARPEDTQQALLAGFDAHIAKPVDPANLAREIAALAGRLRTTSPPASRTPHALSA